MDRPVGGEFIADDIFDMIVAMGSTKLGIGDREFDERGRNIRRANRFVSARDRVFELDYANSLRPGNVGAAMIPDKVSDFDGTRTKFLLVLYVETFKRDCSEVSRGEEKFQRRTRSPSLVICMPSLRCSHLIDYSGGICPNFISHDCLIYQVFRVCRNQVGVGGRTELAHIPSALSAAKSHVR
jgi:hypothetical protein